MSLKTLFFLFLHLKSERLISYMKIGVSYNYNQLSIKRPRTAPLLKNTKRYKMNQATKTLAYDDLCLTCIGCNQPFDYPATEQDFFVKHGLDDPKRCRRCRSMKQANDKPSPYPTGNFAKKPLASAQRQQLRPSYDYLPKEDDSSDEILELKAEVRKMKLELDELKLEMKEMKLYIRSRKVAQMERAAASKSV